MQQDEEEGGARTPGRDSNLRSGNTGTAVDVGSLQQNQMRVPGNPLLQLIVPAQGHAGPPADLYIHDS